MLRTRSRLLVGSGSFNLFFFVAVVPNIKTTTRTGSKVNNRSLANATSSKLKN